MSSYHPRQQTLAQLPQPGADEIQQSERLIELIIDEMNGHGGVISFCQYMNLVLYAPGLGYYSAGLTKLGRGGDFVTSPEVSPLFGRTLANQFLQLFEQGCRKRVLEFGAGSGRLCEQVFARLDNLEDYLILELSADLRQRQQRYLRKVLTSEKFERISWLDKLPRQFDGIVLANEVLDAMPVNLLKKNSRWVELGVGYDGGKFIWCDMPVAGSAIESIVEIESQFGPYADGYTTEINSNYQPWLNALSDSCHEVVGLIIDYGYERAQYYHPQRQQGTLLCHYRHRAHNDPLILPGLQDITASVDFDAVADAAIRAGFEVVGLTAQGRFLLHNGLLEETALNDPGGNTLARLDVAQQIKTLTLPEEMGEKFKVMAFQKNLSLDMPVFDGRR